MLGRAQEFDRSKHFIGTPELVLELAGIGGKLKVAGEQN